MKFTRQEVLEQSERTMKTGESTPVFEAWKKIALGWIVDDEKGLYLQKGFVGWDKRTPEEVLIEFDLNGLLSDPLEHSEFILLWNKLNS